MTDQELMPVAWMHIEEEELIAFENDKNIAEQCEYCVPLYTAQPQREWQGLTDEEIKKIEMSASSKLSAIYLAEAQLKGKNIGAG